MLSDISYIQLFHFEISPSFNFSRCPKNESVQQSTAFILFKNWKNFDWLYIVIYDIKLIFQVI